MKIMKKSILSLVLIFTGIYAFPQHEGLVDTRHSAHAKMTPAGIGEVSLTTGFWADWYGVCRDEMVPLMMDNYLNDTLSHGFANFEIAAGLKQGEHVGPPFHDGDFYKIFEAMIMVNAVEKDRITDRKIDSIINIISATQREDGYIHTPVVIEQRKVGEGAAEFRERLDFETYNMGHLMTAACLHYRTTGKENFLDVAKKATDFLYDFYMRNPEELAKNAICPSHYMGVTEMYRTTADPRYLELAKGLIDIRSHVENGTDHNQDRIPFREQTTAIGHAVRANYLYAGAADVYAETGDESLMQALDAIWHDLAERKLYITGGCGALYDGVSPNGTTYDQPSIQQVHQAYGQDFELPNLDAHNESCANIGNMLWNWRMLLATGKAAYADMLEQVAYNSLLGAVNLDGSGYFYTNPLAVNQDITYQLRWSKVREPYISYCNCCPPNTIRTIAEMQNYLYGVSDEGLYVHLYGGSTLKTVLPGGEKLELTQETDYPWEGKVLLKIQKAPKKEFSMFLRIPGWERAATVAVNNEIVAGEIKGGSYFELNRKWKKGDEVTLVMDIRPFLVQSNPLVEENRNMVAVQSGPVVYCLESEGLPEGIRLSDVMIPLDTDMKLKNITIRGSRMNAVETDALVMPGENWQGSLYRRLDNSETETIHIQLIPYYAWGNRGEGDMEVWLPVRW